MNELNIGRKVTEYRAQRKMSSKELAEKAGLTPSMLSQIEHSQANPSINTIKKIAAALNIPIYRLFQEEEIAAPLIMKKSERRIIGYPDVEDIRYEMLLPVGGASIELCIMHISPSEESSENLICHAGEEAASVLSGKVTLIYEDMAYNLEAGDSVRIMPNISHRWMNNSNETAEVIFAITPPTF